MLVLILAPLLGGLSCGLFGRYLGYNLSKLFACISILISTLISYKFYNLTVLQNNEISIILFQWLNIGLLENSWEFTIDKLSATMLITITTISLLCHCWGIGYMSHDPNCQRFFSYLNLFTFCMIITVSGNNILVIFTGWELVGVVSYLLISFWFNRLSAMKSALSAILLNRVGDSFFVLAIIILFNLFGSINIESIITLVPFVNTNLLFLGSLCLFMGAVAKSTQFGLHCWLLLSMEAPTVVSSLLHSSTMVTLGVFLLLKFSFILEYSNTILLIIMFLGSFTTFIAGTIAIFSYDIKRIIALSTMSQLGLMVLAIGMSSYNLALFHLFCHSTFKALLFLSAGSIIHCIASEYQDIRVFGSLIKFIPITYICMFIASCSLMAIPGLSGFYSKDIIIEFAKGTYTISGTLSYWLALFSAIFTCIYSTKILFFVFFNIPNSSKYALLKSNITISESSWIMLIPMIILSILSIFLGYIFKDIYFGLGVPFTGIFNHPNNISIIETEFTLNYIYKILPFISVILSILITLIIYENINKLNILNIRKYNIILRYFNQKIYYDKLLNLFIRYYLNIGGKLNYNIDKGILQILGPQGAWLSFKQISNILINNKINNIIRNNTILIFTWIIIFIIILFIPLLIPNIFNIIIILLLSWIIKK